MLKPNLVNWNPSDVTKRPVIESLAKLMLQAGKDVFIGEGSAAGPSIIRPENVGYVCRTQSVAELNGIQKYVYDALGYDELAKNLKIPLVNLHVGEMAKIPLSGGFVFKELENHRALSDMDLLCSVPMMKTHGLAGVNRRKYLNGRPQGNAGRRECHSQVRNSVNQVKQLMQHN